MSNYRVRQVMQLRRKQRVKDFLIGLATFMTDDSRTAEVGVDALMRASGQARNTFREARREAEASGDVVSAPTGTGRGHLTQWTVLCLPEASPEAAQPRKGVSAVNPVSAANPLSELKGVNPAAERGSNGDQKGGQGQAADQQQPRMLNRMAKPSGSTAAAGTIRQAFPDATDEEIEIIVTAKTQKGAISVPAVLAHEIGTGTLRLPCDRQGAGKHTEACRAGDTGRCAHSWCRCRCHLRPVISNGGRAA